MQICPPICINHRAVELVAALASEFHPVAMVTDPPADIARNDGAAGSIYKHP
jgi:hypothetical protein